MDEIADELLAVLRPADAAFVLWPELRPDLFPTELIGVGAGDGVELIRCVLAFDPENRTLN
jgi:hypothetical protein